MTMASDERHELEELVELLGSRDWRERREANAALERVGDAALDAVIDGLSHPDGLVRRHCAAFMDHHATDRCIPALRTALHDPVGRVRREAVHALTCEPCKPAPLDLDATPILIERALADSSPAVRRSAAWGLTRQPPDARVIEPMRQVLERDTDWQVRRAAHRVLRLHDPAYRAATDRRARERASAARREAVTDQPA